MAKSYAPHQPGQRVSVRHSDDTVLRDKGSLGATFQSAAFAPHGAPRLGLFIDVDSATGTTPTLDVTLEISFDKGTTWVALPAAENSETGAAHAQVTTSATKVFEWYNMCGDPEFTRVRAVFTIGGSSPGYDFNDCFWITQYGVSP